MRKHNPFTPGSGLRPPHLAGRETELNKLTNALSRTIDCGKGKTIVMYGPRGTGKTVLMNWFEKQCEKEGVIAVKTTPSTGLKSTEALAQRLLPRDWLPKELSVGIQGFLSAGWTRPDTNTHGMLDDYLIEACRNKPRVLLLDEAHTLDAEVCRNLLNISQAVSNKAPFLLVMAGTPGLEPFLMSVGATFVERSQTIGVGRLSEQAAAEAIVNPLIQEGVSIDSNALAKVIEDTQCYPYFLQLWGEGLWNVAAEQGTTELTGKEVEMAKAEIEATRTHFYLKRHDAMRNDQPVLQAAAAVAKAFQNREGLDESALIDVIENNLLNTLDDGKSRRDEALRVESELNRIDYIWRPPGSTQFEPGIPSFMTFVQSRAKRSKEVLRERTSRDGRDDHELER